MKLETTLMHIRFKNKDKMHKLKNLISIVTNINIEFIQEVFNREIKRADQVFMADNDDKDNEI